MGVILRVDGFSRIYMYKDFVADFKKVCSPEVSRYQKRLDRNLHTLEYNKKMVADYARIEKLHNTDPPIYSIRSPHSKLNTRVFFFILDGNGNFCLLHVFKKNRQAIMNAHLWSP